LTQRLNDMKKTLQRELKFQTLPNEKQQQQQPQQDYQPSAQTTNQDKKYSFDSSPALQSTNKQDLLKKHSNLNYILSKSAKPMPNVANLSNLHDDVNFKYLKHVVLKFLTSREYEVSSKILFLLLTFIQFIQNRFAKSIHLVKALSVLLNFTGEEEKILKETLEWKMSWFGSKPKYHS